MLKQEVDTITEIIHAIMILGVFVAAIILMVHIL